MIKVEFTKDFATKKKGDVEEYSNSLASTLIRVDKVAKAVKPKKKDK
jgi:hypothetical protein